MPDFLPLLRARYPKLARDLLSPLFEVLRVARATCGDDLDKFLIILAVAMRTVEHRDMASFDLEAVLSGEVDVYPSLSTNVRSVSDSTGIPKESVRRKVQALIEEGWIRRDGGRLALDTRASQALTPVREQILQMAVRHHQAVIASAEETRGR